MPHYFTVNEANAVVDTLRPWIKEILETRQRILDRMPEVWPAVNRSLGNGGNPIASAVDRDYRRIDVLYKQILATGVEVKDINTGLLDFLSLREGHEVYLCWRYDEKEILYWHELDAGFAGRTPL
jgi:hypothetical protein